MIKLKKPLCKPRVKSFISWAVRQTIRWRAGCLAQEDRYKSDFCWEKFCSIWRFQYSDVKGNYAAGVSQLCTLYCLACTFSPISDDRVMAACGRSSCVTDYLASLFLFYFNRWSGDTTKASRLAKSSRYTGRNTSSTLSACSVRRPTELLSMWASTLARYETQLSHFRASLWLCL